ncbi:MAG: hypothetical protein KME32_13585 [Mojavia pulchra JT2-VF2]|jgi:probable HAF family extracellular repeat protein|uniref:PEP-CTERM sorting domain-containing protein n=1 Tax=Mojavia pulchra JT2-VF2 TaxID=287848 RepID=A0A951UGE0_9NOST|nr:hypothetical protein [Mojavia pulchra JT2-VF2]
MSISNGIRNLSTATLGAALITLGIPKLAIGASLYSILDLGTLGGERTDEIGVSDINNSGQVVGYADAPGGLEFNHAFLAEKGSIKDLGTLGGYNSAARGINNSKQVVGESLNSSLLRRGFLWEKGVMTELKTLGGPWSVATNINDAGTVVGFSTPTGTTEEEHAVLWKNGQIQDLGTLNNSSYSFPSDINELEQVVGYSDGRAFLWENGVTKDLGTLGGDNSSAYSINNLGQVVGYSDVEYGFPRHAFLWEDGVMESLGTLGGDDSYAYDINNLGQVVGSSQTGKLREYPYLPSNLTEEIAHGFLWENGVMTDLNTLIPDSSGWEVISSWGINDLGQITGVGVKNSQWRAFLMSPKSVPEPGSIFGSLLALTGGVGLALKYKKYKQFNGDFKS